MDAQHILIADDDPGCLALTSRIVSDMGLTPVTAVGREVALALFRGGDCAAVVADLSMEGADSGLRLAEDVRRLRPGTPVILMTGRPGTDSAIPGMRAGVCDYLIKPFRPKELSDSIRRALSRRRLSAELDMERATREELKAAYQQLAKVERLRESMLSIVGHELRTPLCAAELAAELLTASPGEGEAARAQELLKANLARLRSTVEELLLHAKLAAGRVAAAPVATDLLALVRKEAELIRPLAEERKLALHCAFPENGALVPLDPDLAAQAVRQLLLNAVRFNRDHGRIRVDVAYEPAQAVVCVLDDGPGIDDAETQKILDPYYQAADFMTRRVGGLGLGLAIVKLAMDAHGGSVQAHREAGGGSRFILSFPIYSASMNCGRFVALRGMNGDDHAANQP